MLIGLLPIVVQADLFWCQDGDSSSLVTEKIAGQECRLVKKTDDPPSKNSKKSTAKTATPANFPNVTASEQRERDRTKQQVLEYELQREQQSHSDALKIYETSNNQSERVEYGHRAKNHALNIKAIKQELARLN